MEIKILNRKSQSELVQKNPFRSQFRSSFQTNSEKNQPLIPNHVSKTAKDFILKLLTKNPRRRLGTKGLEDVKRHPFFGPDIDWEAIAQKGVAAPIKPKIKDEMDTSNFADEFTRLPLTDSPGFAPPTESLFRGYSFISPTVLFGPTNAVNEDLYNLLRLTNHQRPDPSQLHRLIKTSPFFQNYELIDREGFLGEGSFSICRSVSSNGGEILIRRVFVFQSLSKSSNARRIRGENRLPSTRSRHAERNRSASGVSRTREHRSSARDLFRRSNDDFSCSKCFSWDFVAAAHVHHHGIVNRWRIVLSDSNSSVVFRERGQSTDEETGVRGELHAQ